MRIEVGRNFKADRKIYHPRRQTLLALSMTMPKNQQSRSLKFPREPHNVLDVRAGKEFGKELAQSFDFVIKDPWAL